MKLISYNSNLRIPKLPSTITLSTGSLSFRPLTTDVSANRAWDPGGTCVGLWGRR